MIKVTVRNKKDKNSICYYIISVFLIVFVFCLSSLMIMISFTLTGKDNSNSQFLTTTTSSMETVVTTTAHDYCLDYSFSGTDITTVNDFNEGLNLISLDTKCTINMLDDKYYTLLKQVSSYDDYRSSNSVVDDYFKTVKVETFNLIVRLRKYDSETAKKLVSSDGNLYDKYDDLDSLYNEVDNAVTKIENRIYEGIFKDLNSYYCEGIIKSKKGFINDSEYDTAYYRCGNIYYNTRHVVYNYYQKIDLNNYVMYGSLKGSFYKNNRESAMSAITKMEKDTNGFVEVWSKTLN